MPGDHTLDADDRSEASVLWSDPPCLQHPLVVRKLQQIILPLPRSEQRLVRGGLPGRGLKCRVASRRRVVRPRIEGAMVLDVRGPVAGASVGPDQEIGFADTTADLVVGKSATD